MSRKVVKFTADPKLQNIFSDQGISIPHGILDLPFSKCMHIPIQLLHTSVRLDPRDQLGHRVKMEVPIILKEPISIFQPQL